MFVYVYIYTYINVCTYVNNYRYIYMPWTILMLFNMITFHVINY